MKKLTAFVIAAAMAATAWAQGGKQPKFKNKKEQDAFMAIQDATTPDDRIKAAESFLSRFSDSQFKAIALQFEVMSYQQKNDFNNMLITGERTLEVDPNNVMVLVSLAAAIPQKTGENDLDKDEKLNKAEKYADQAQKAVPNLEKMNPQITDDKWADYKKSLMSQVHEAKGRIALKRKDFPGAEKSFQAAVDVAPEPDATCLYELGMAFQGEKKYDQAIAAFDKSSAAGGVKVGGRDFASIQKAATIKQKADAAKEAAGGSAAPAEQPKQ